MPMVAVYLFKTARRWNLVAVICSKALISEKSSVMQYWLSEIGTGPPFNSSRTERLRYSLKRPRWRSYSTVPSAGGGIVPILNKVKVLKLSFAFSFSHERLYLQQTYQTNRRNSSQYPTAIQIHENFQRYQSRARCVSFHHPRFSRLRAQWH